MADTKLKNITRVDILEQSSGVEKVLVEAEDTLKRLPIDQIKGNGGGGAGFDVMGNIETVFIPNSGELVIMDPIEIEADPQSEPGFNDFFGQGPFDTNNIYQRFVNITNLGMEATFYGYSNKSNVWEYTMDVSDLSEYGEMGYRVGAICPYTYAELLEAQALRPITAIFNYSTSGTVYLQTVGSFPGALAKIQFASILPSEILEMESIIFLVLGNMDNSLNGFGYLILYEAGTASEPVLGTCFIPKD